MAEYNIVVKFYHPPGSILDSIRMSTWCKEHGLVLGIDFNWEYSIDENEITFRFSNKDVVTMFLLSFAGQVHEVV